MKIKNIIVLLSAFIIASCNEDDMQLTEQQRELIGQAVNFDASMADVFSTRTTYNHDGSFNENDQLTIYRQYISSNNKEFDAKSEISRVYVYAPMTSGSISLGAEWKAMNGDSLIWENDKTVRFRAWGRSNLADLLRNSSKTNYYPDFTISSWKGAYGPTVTIPLQMRHLACRIGISQKSGNELVSAEICTSASEYTDSEGMTAEKKAAAVQAAYDLMCMPAGVNMTDETLYSITQEAFNAAANALATALTGAGYKAATLSALKITSNAFYNETTHELVTIGLYQWGGEEGGYEIYVRVIIDVNGAYVTVNA